jgi:uroporphyrin-III C-methyltransferase/precorrin-2 dehydrogenase/sirohydrochlorin ferrochelatase
LTYRAIRRLQESDLVLYDGLVPTPLLQLATGARHVSVSRRAGEHRLTEADVIDLMIDGARRGERVVRLKAGDPFVLGRGGEEVLALVDAGIPVEVVPGVTSAVAAPALAGIPVTHRGLASHVVVVSGHSRAIYAGLLAALPPKSATIVVLMGMAERAWIAASLLGARWPTDTAVALVINASRPDQDVWRGTLGGLANGESPDVRDAPGVIIIGDVVSLADRADELRAGAGAEEKPWPFKTIPRL